VEERVWKEGEEFIKKVIPKLRTNNLIQWTENGTGYRLRVLCELLKANVVPTEILDLNGDEK